MADLIFINPDQKVQTTVLAGLLSRNTSIIHQWSKDGKLPQDVQQSTYREALDHLVTFLIRNEGIRMMKAQEEIRLKEEKLNKDAEVKRSRFAGSGDAEDGMHPLMAAKLKQSIKTEYAREAELWQKISIKRGEFVAFADKLDLVEGFITSINDTLNFISNNYPDIQSRVDEAKEELFQLGITLCAEADIDANNYVDTMLAKEPELDE